MEQNWMVRKSKFNKPGHVRIVEVAAVDEEVTDHMALVALDEEVDLDVEMIDIPRPLRTFFTSSAAA